MKLVIQIPCRDEVEHLPTTLAELPRVLPGVDEIEWLVIDDGSTDGTAECARALGVRHVVRFERHQGLGRAFAAGVEAALAAGADLIVNTDADNQYRGADVAALVAPLLRGEAELVVGDRRPGESLHFSPLKRRLQRLGSAVVRWMSGVPVADAASGFRALSRDGALRLLPRSAYSHTLETLLLAGELGLRVTSVPVHTNPPRRPSRLFRSLPAYLLRSGATLLGVRLRRRPRGLFLGGTGLLLTAALGAGLGWAGGAGATAGRVGVGLLAGSTLLAGLGVGAERAAARRRVAEGQALAERRRRLEGRAPGPAHAEPGPATRGGEAEAPARRAEPAPAATAPTSAAASG